MDKTTRPVSTLDSKEDRYLVPGLIRGLQTLAAFTPERREMSLSEIAREIGLGGREPRVIVLSPDEEAAAALRAQLPELLWLLQMGVVLKDGAAGTQWERAR